jgi:hypothetical protein
MATRGVHMPGVFTTSNALRGSFLTMASCAPSSSRSRDRKVACPSPMSRFGKTTRPLILFGGGLDSCALVFSSITMARPACYFDYGQKATVRGVPCDAALCGEVRVATSRSRCPAADPLRGLPADHRARSSSSATHHARTISPGATCSSRRWGSASPQVSRNLAPIMLGASPAPPESAFNDAKQEFATQFNVVARLRVPGQRPPLLMPGRRGNRETTCAQRSPATPSFSCVVHLLREHFRRRMPTLRALPAEGSARAATRCSLLRRHQ